MPARRHRWVAVALAAAAAGACSSRGTESRAERRPSADSPAAIRADLDHPLEALKLDGDEAAARLGSFAWQGDVTWTVEKPGATPVKAVEHHRVRQLATGEFDASADVDPGAGPGSETGRHVVYARGLTYARGRWSPFRERPTDRGHGARRFRDQSFRLAADLADLCGPGLVARADGDATVAGRRARRFRLSLDASRRPVAAPVPGGVPGGAYDPDTKRHVAFLQGRVPTAATGELVLDAQTGVPLSVNLDATFAEQEDPAVRVAVQLAARVTSLGGAVAAVTAPRGALPDEGKPKGVARALEAAGLRKREAPAEPPDDEPGGDEPPPHE